MTGTEHIIWLALILLLVFSSVFTFIYYGWRRVKAWVISEEQRYDRVLNQQLLLDQNPRLVMVGVVILIIFLCATALSIFGDPITFAAAGALGLFFPTLVLRHLEQKRRARLEVQIVDGIMTLASGVRAGLTMMQSMELLAANSADPIRQEFAQLAREYQMGLDLSSAMRNASNRIGSPYYRLLFTAIDMHRQRGGDTGESLDRITESIREIQRLEGKLEAVTAQGRSQARMMGIMPVVLMGIYYLVDPVGVEMLFTRGSGRIILLICAMLILGGFVWIRRIMVVDI